MVQQVSRRQGVIESSQVVVQALRRSLGSTDDGGKLGFGV